MLAHHIERPSVSVSFAVEYPLMFLNNNSDEFYNEVERNRVTTNDAGSIAVTPASLASAPTNSTAENGNATTTATTISIHGTPPSMLAVDSTQPPAKRAKLVLAVVGTGFTDKCVFSFYHMKLNNTKSGTSA